MFRCGFGFYRFCNSVLKAELNKAKTLDVKNNYLTLQRKWAELCVQTKNEKPQVWNDKLNSTSLEKIDLLSQHINRLSTIELRYLLVLMREKFVNRPKSHIVQPGLTFEELNSIDSGIFPTAHPKFFAQQEALAKLWPLGQQGLSMMFSQVMGGGSGGEASDAKSQSPKVEAPKEEKKIEEKIEKKNYDIQLNSFDAASKIKVIKEVREIFKLGLKEAKDLVESVPCVLAKQVKKDEAEELKKKLEALQCKITLL